MKLKVVSPLEVIEKSVEWVEVNTNVGNFVIQKGHIPLILILAPNQAFTYKVADKQPQSLTIKKGIASVTRTSFTALIHLDD